MEQIKEKKCKVCGDVKPLSQFSKSYRNRCKECVAAATRQRRAAAKAFWEAVRNMHHGIVDAQRYELTKIALQGFMTHAEIEGMDSRQLAEMAVDIADETLRALSITNVAPQNQPQ